MALSGMARTYRMGKEGTIVHTDELDAAKTEIKTEIGELRRHCLDKVDQVTKHTRSAMEPLTDLAAKNAADIETLRHETKTFAEECVDGLKKQLSEVIENVQSSLMARLDAEVAATNARCDALGAEAKEMRLVQEGLDERLRTQRSELTSEFRQELSSAIAVQAAAQDRSVKALEGSLGTWKQRVHEETAENQRLNEEKARADLMENIQQMTHAKITAKAGEVMGEVQQHLERHDQQLLFCEKTMTEEISGRGAKVCADLDRLTEDAGRRLALVENESVELREAVTAASSYTTRSVDWVIPDLMRQFSGTAQSWFSPRFAAAGETGLQLELQVCTRVPIVESATEVPRAKGSNESDIPKAKKDRDASPEKPMLEAKLNLWAGSSPSTGENSTLAFRFSLAGMCGPSQEGRFERWSPCPAGRTWRLDERMSREDGSIRVVAEFLTSATSVDLQRETPLSLVQAPLLPELTLPYAGSISVQHHIDNRVDERMRSCMVRRIEWRLEKASGLKALFPRGECVHSTVFSAAGMEGLQLIFYPMGCASAPSGYSSFFMQCPGEAMPRAWLHIGRHRMEALHEDQQPGWVGRIKFWHCEKVVETEIDTVVLAVDIQEAPCEALQVHVSNDPRRYLRKNFAGGVDVRAPGHARPKSSLSSSAKQKRRPPPPVSDSTLARGAQTSQWMTQAYVDSAAGYARSTTPRGQSSDRMPPLTPSPPLGMQSLVATAPICC